MAVTVEKRRNLR